MTTVAAWAANKTKFSLADGTGHFYFADRRSLYDRAADNTHNSGDYLANEIKETTVTVQVPNAQDTNPRNFHGFIYGGDLHNTTPLDITIGSGTETNPETVYINKYKLI